MSGIDAAVEGAADVDGRAVRYGAAVLLDGATVIETNPTGAWSELLALHDGNR